MRKKVCRPPTRGQPLFASDLHRHVAMEHEVGSMHGRSHRSNVALRKVETIFRPKMSPLLFVEPWWCDFDFGVRTIGILGVLEGISISIW